MSDVLVPLSLMQNPGDFGGAVQGECLRGGPIWREQRLVGLSPPAGGRAQVVIPKLTEAHCHLDKCHSLPRMQNVGGDLAAAIKAQMQDKTHWTANDLRARAGQGLAELKAAGVAQIRSHIDWGQGAAPPLSWSTLTEFAPQVQWSPLTGIEQMAEPGFAGALAKLCKDVLGSFILDHDPAKIRAGLTQMIRAADARGLMLDFHVDEGLGAYNGLEMIADALIEHGFQGPVLCGHAVSLMDRAPDDFARITEKLLQTNITICALPTTNLYLQGRGTGSPDRRGLTPLKDLHRAGVPVIVASDNVRDAFCPLGQHDPRAALHLACLTAHLDPPLGQWLPLITHGAQRALGRAPIYIDGARRSDLLSCDVADLASLIAGHAPLKGHSP